jgi:hypothetical protein
MDIFEHQYFTDRFAEIHQHIEAAMRELLAGDEKPERTSATIEMVPAVDASLCPVSAPILNRMEKLEEPKKRGRKPAAGQVPFPTIVPVLPPPSEALAPQEINTIPFDPEEARIEALRKEHGIEPLVFDPEKHVREADGIHIMDDLSAMTLQEVAPKFTEIADKIGRDVALSLIKEHAGVASLKDVKPEQYTKLYHIFKKAYHNACQADSLTI